MTWKTAGPVRSIILAASLAFVWLPATTSAQDIQYRDGRFRETLGGVTIQRADEAGSDEAVLNMPFLPGDRVWTDDAGRAEILFAEGEALWIAERSKIDSLGRGGILEDERLGLQVFAGSFVARVQAGGPGFEFRAPGGNIISTGAAVFRLDVWAGDTVVSVSEGAVLADLGGERLPLGSGERVRYANGRLDGPFAFDPGRADSFDLWCEERAAELSRMARVHDRLPDELHQYGYELEQNGEWIYEEPQGYVYVPRVPYDWAPYTYGRWVYTRYGWTWVADEPWGFVTSHYGRWGYSSRIGWHWLPRAGFSGAWVGWSSPVGRWSHTIGWCALGFNDRPVASLGYGSAGRAVPRGTDRGWTFADRADMGRFRVQRQRVDLPAGEAQQAVLWNPEASPDRDFRPGRRASGNPGGGGAVRRGEGGSGRGSDSAARINVRPSPGDSAPELRSDPTTTIPSPESRRQRTIGQDGFKDEQDNRGRARRDAPGLSTDRGGSPPASDSARPRPAGSASPGPRSALPDGAAPPPATGAERPTRDPLLSRFFRSITRPNPGVRTSSPDAGSDSAVRRTDPPARDDSANRRTAPPERSRPADRDRPQTRPSGGERAQPRTGPPPRATPKEGGSDNRGAKRRERKDP